MYPREYNLDDKLLIENGFINTLSYYKAGYLHNETLKSMLASKEWGESRVLIALDYTPEIAKNFLYLNPLSGEGYKKFTSYMKRYWNKSDKERENVSMMLTYMIHQHYEYLNFRNYQEKSDIGVCKPLQVFDLNHILNDAFRAGHGELKDRKHLLYTSAHIFVEYFLVALNGVRERLKG